MSRIYNAIFGQPPDDFPPIMVVLLIVCAPFMLAHGTYVFFKDMVCPAEEPENVNYEGFPCD